MYSNARHPGRNPVSPRTRTAMFFSQKSLYPSSGVVSSSGGEPVYWRVIAGGSPDPFPPEKAAHAEVELLPVGIGNVHVEAARLRKFLRLLYTPQKSNG